MGMINFIYITNINIIFVNMNFNFEEKDKRILKHDE